MSETDSEIGIELFVYGTSGERKEFIAVDMACHRCEQRRGGRGQRMRMRESHRNSRAERGGLISVILQFNPLSLATTQLPRSPPIPCRCIHPLKSVTAHNRKPPGSITVITFIPVAMRQEFIVVAGKKYCYVDQQAPIQSQPRGTLLCLHGFPDQWYVPPTDLPKNYTSIPNRYGWDNQIAAWSRAGYRVIVPHMLGYGQSVSIHPIH
jgi:hypothetical protein